MPSARPRRPHQFQRPCPRRLQCHRCHQRRRSPRLQSFCHIRLAFCARSSASQIMGLLRVLESTDVTCAARARIYRWTRKPVCQVHNRLWAHRLCPAHRLCLGHTVFVLRRGAWTRLFVKVPYRHARIWDMIAAGTLRSNGCSLPCRKDARAMRTEVLHGLTPDQHVLFPPRFAHHGDPERLNGERGDQVRRHAPSAGL